MKYKRGILIFCILTCIFFTTSCAFACDVANETIGETYLDAQELQVTSDSSNNTDLLTADSYSTVYFDASAASDGDGSKSNPYKIYKSDRIPFGATVYFADGVYDITDASSIHSSSAHKTTFIGQSIENTILNSKLTNKFDFTVSDNSYFVLKDLTMTGVHINNQANLIANNVAFKNSDSFNPDYPPALSYSYIPQKYDSTYGGVIICDTPSNKITVLNLTDCYFNSNSASSGGVIATYNSLANIQNCIFYNSSASRFGGAIYSIKSTLNIIGSSFELNNAKYGGAIFANCSDFNIKNSQFKQSEAYSFGGVIASFSSNLDINNVIFSDYASLNDAGGAIYTTAGTVKVTDSTFKDGYSDFGGAICNLKADLTVQNSDLINNHATYYGGSIYNMYGNLAINSNNFNSSYARSGGSIFNRISDSFGLSGNTFISSTANEGPIVFIDGDHVQVVEKSNIYDASYILLKYGNVYDVDYYKSVPLINYTPEVIAVMPSSYDSRKYGYVTPAKDQIQGGNCWAFSGIATLEACLKKATGIEYDFSEENVKNLMSEYSLFDSDTGANSGGNLYMFIAYLAGWFGPTFDEYDTYDDFSALSVIYDSEIHVQNVYILPERQSFYDNDYIKQAVLKYGAVSIGINLDQNRGHAVTIVGWDDEFTSSDFLGNKALGAWIIKNSWGTQWGYNGFGYLSYQQPISFGYTFIFDDDRGYTNIYQYDFEGKSGSHTVDKDQVYLKNKFVAKNDEILSAFSTYFDVPTNYTASIYLNGKLVTTQSGFSERGYYTIPLLKEISLKKGDSFEIEIKYTNGGDAYFPICSATEINKMNFGKGLSYFSVDGVTWMDLYDEAPVKGVACIKAFTRTDSLSDISIDVDQSGAGSFDNIYVDDLVNIVLDLPETYTVGDVQYSLDGLVTFNVNGQNYFATVKNGKACLNISFEKEGNYNIKAQFKSNRVISNIIEFTAKVSNASSSIVIQAKDISKFYGGPEYYVATLTDGGKVLSGVNVKITVDGKEYTVKTDANGKVTLDLQEFPAGVYYISTQYGGKIATSKFAILSTIHVNDLTQEFLNAYISASFINTDGNVISNKDVTFKVSMYGENSNTLEFDAVTDLAGLATAQVDIGVDKYSVSVVNPVTGEEKQFILDVTPIDCECLLSVTQSGSNVIFDATIGPLGIPASGHVNFLFLGNVYKAEIKEVVSNGQPIYVARIAVPNLAVGNYNVEAIYSGDQNLRVSSDSREFSVTNNPYVLRAPLYVQSLYGSSVTYAYLYDSNNKGISGETVYATILNKRYSAVTDENGRALFYDSTRSHGNYYVYNLDLDIGEYPVVYEYKGQSLEKYIIIKSTIDMDISNVQYLNSTIGAKFSNTFGDDDEKYDVKFIVNGTEYSATTNNGYASVDVNLPVGTHTITTVNPRSGEKKLSEVTVYKTTPTITLSKEKRGNSMFITADLAHTFAEGYIVFTMGSNKYTTLVSKGKAVLVLSVLDEGSYSIYANYIGDPNFNNILSSTMDFDYEITNYTLSASSVSKYYGGSEKFTVTLTNFNKPVSNADIEIIINDAEKYTITTNANGVASFDRELNPGIYTVQANFEDKTIVYSMTVNPTITVISAVEDVSTDKISAEFIDSQRNYIKNTVVKFLINGKEYKATTDSWGVANLQVGLDKGSYTVTIVNPVTGENKKTTLTITKSTPSLTLSAVNENGVDILKAVLPKDATGTVDFVLDNGDIYTYGLEEGIASLEGLDPGDYTVDVSYKGNAIYNPVSKSINFHVSEVTGVITASNVKTTYGTAKNIVITLKDSLGNILTGRTVKFTLNNKVYDTPMPSDGKAIIKIPANLAPKTYTVKITYSGEEDILPASKTIKVVVSKATPKLTAAKKTFKIKDKTKKYVVTLKTDKNKVYKSQKITIKVNGKSYTAKTNKKGQAIFKLTKLTKKGSFTAVIKFAGNSKYNAVTKKVKLTVKK